SQFSSSQALTSSTGSRSRAASSVISLPHSGVTNVVGQIVHYGAPPSQDGGPCPWSRRAVDRPSVAAAPLDLVHRLVGAAEQLGVAHAPTGGRGDADADRHRGEAPPDVERLAHR